MPSAQDKARLENPLSQAPKQQSSSTPPRWLRRGSSSLGIKPSSTLLNYSNSWSTVEAIHFSASSYRGAAMPSGTKFPNSPPSSGKASHLLIPSTNSMTVQATAMSTRASRMLCYVFPNSRSTFSKLHRPWTRTRGNLTLSDMLVEYVVGIPWAWSLVLSVYPQDCWPQRSWPCHQRYLPLCLWLWRRS